MPIVTEYLDAYPIDDNVLVIKRDEELLLTRPDVKIVKLLTHEPLQVVHFATKYTPLPFSPPKGVYEGEHLRVEWQQMKGRQPFYHRNADVDELSFQVSGPRTTMTEHGTVEMSPGMFSRIPVGVAHDNYGREAVHLLFYIPAPVKEAVPVTIRGEYRNPAFEGWKPRAIEELITSCLGGPECDLALSLTDEALLLREAEDLDESQRLPTIRPTADVDGGTQWLFKSQHVWIGFTRQSSRIASPEDTAYRRHRRADEIQAQIKGSRTVISQRGIVRLEPGDFVTIPQGVAFTDVVDGHGHQDGSEHISILTFYPTPPKAAIAREAEPLSWKAAQSLRAKASDGIARNGE